MNHPPPRKLDAIAAGDLDETSEAHVQECADCRAYVAEMREAAEHFRKTTDAGAFAEAVKSRMERTEKPVRHIGRAIWVAAPMLAVAAAIALWIHSDTTTDPPSIGGPTASTGDPARFKGGIAVTVIRERAGRQERLTGPFQVAAGDRVRVEVAVDHERPITAGLLMRDGTWTPLFAAASLEAGTHYSELAARFDATPTDALLLVGDPDAIERARSARKFEGVVSWHVWSASTP